MKCGSWGVALVAAGCASAGVDADESAGKAVFERWCVHCHAAGPGYPGTQRLGWNLGPDRALIEARTDLEANYVRQVVRQGLAEMPSFRVTEISVAELDALAEYLAR